jgi:hypothetical protein
MDKESHGKRVPNLDFDDAYDAIRTRLAGDI